MSILKRSSSAICVALVVMAAAGTAQGQDYPTRPVRIISGFGPGSAGDMLARIVSQKLSPALGQQFIIEHKPGGGSNIAAEFVARAPADGYTLFLGTSANTINATLSPNLSFDFSKDFAPVTLMGSVPNILVVHPALGVGNVQELIALARSKPEQNVPSRPRMTMTRTSPSASARLTAWSSSSSSCWLTQFFLWGRLSQM